MCIKYFLTDWLDLILMAFTTLAMGYACINSPKDMPRPAAGAIKQSNWVSKIGRSCCLSRQSTLFHTQFSQAPDTEHFILYKSLSLTRFLHNTMQAVWKAHMVHLSAHKRAEGLLCLPLWQAKNQQTHCPMCVSLLTI